MNGVLIGSVTTAVCFVSAAMTACGFCRLTIVGSKRMCMGVLYARMFSGDLVFGSIQRHYVEAGFAKYADRVDSD